MGIDSFLVLMSTMYLNLKSDKTRLETVLHTLLVSESQRSLLPLVIPKDGVPTLDQDLQRTERDRVLRVTVGALSGSSCHRLGLDRIDDHMIIVTPVGCLI